MNESGAPLKVVFLGTSDFALEPLQAILKSRHILAAVVTKSDRSAGRGQKQLPTPVKKFMEDSCPALPLLQPDSLKDPAFLDMLRRFQPDIFVVASFPIMPKILLQIPPLGCLNIHPSLLPKYRGAAPIHWTLMNGDSVTGVTTFFIGGQIDAGNIFLQQSLEILPWEDYGSLHHRLSVLGAVLALKSLDLIAQSKVTTYPQDESQATPAPKIRNEHCRIDWNRPAHTICNQIHALSPQPGAYTYFQGKRLKLFAARICPEKLTDSGTAKIQQDRIFIACQDQSLELLEVQLEGKKRMKTADFIHGLKSNYFRLTST